METLRTAIELGFSDRDIIRTDTDLFAIQPRTEFAKILAKMDGKAEVEEQLTKAQELIESEDYDEAAKIYKKILDDDPKNAFACYRLGYALHAAGKLDEAIVYHEKATKFPGTCGIANYNWGCALSLKGDKEHALKKLRQAVKHGYVRLDAYHNDPDLDNLRDEKDFQDLVAQLESDAKEKSNNGKSQSPDAEQEKSEK